MPLLTYYTADQLAEIGFAAIGRDVQIDSTCRFHRPQRIWIGSHVRIDAYTTLRGSEPGLRIGNYVHLSTHVTVSGIEAVTIEDFCGISSGVAIFATTDDFSGNSLANPTVPAELRNMHNAPVVLRRHALIGAGAVILPGVEIGEGAAVGALSLVNKSVPPWIIVSGNPLRQIGTRSRKLLELEKKIPRSESSDER